MSTYLRNRLQAIEDRIGSRDNASPSTRIFVGEVIDGGHMPTGPDKVYLVRPVAMDGSPSEGKAGSITADPTRDVPVIVLGSTPNVGDRLQCYAVGGRWVAQKGSTISCQPQIAGCLPTYYGDNGTVTDTINGTQPIVFDFDPSVRAWFSTWLPFTGDRVLASHLGVSPCTWGMGPSYYFYRLNSTAVDIVHHGITAHLCLPGQMCVDNHGDPVFSIYPYPHGTPQYPALLGSPATTEVPILELPSASTPDTCDPAVIHATFDTSAALGASPLSSAVFEVPKWSPTPYAWACGYPCPLPRKDLHLSWTKVPSGSGSGTLVYDATTKRWDMACTGGLSVRVTMNGLGIFGLLATVTDNADCTGSLHVFTYPVQVAMTSYTCDPLMIEFKPVFISQLLYAKGYRSFTVTE